MSNGNDIEVRVTANLGELERGMEQAAQSVESGAQRMDNSFKEAGDSMAGVAEVVRSRMAMVAGIAAAAFASIGLKSAAEDAARFTESSMDLGRAMGVSASQASVWAAVLDDVGASQEELAAASRGLTTRLRDNEEDLNRMGLVTRDSNGKLRNMNDLMHDAIAVVNSYREGTDRNAAAQEVFGRAVTGSSKLLMVSRDAAQETEEKMRALGIVVGENNVEAWREYDQASDDAALTMKGVQMTIGQALIPVMTEFKASIVAIGPQLVNIARVALETFLGVVDLARMVKQAFVSVGTDIGAVAAAAALALRGDFTGAMNVFRERAADAVRETQKLKDLWNGTGDSFLGKFRQKWEASATSDQGGSDYVAPPTGGGGSRNGSGAKADGPIDALGSGSYITSDKGTAEMIRQQQDAINAMYGEMAREAEKAAQAAEAAFRKSAQQQMQVDLIRAQSARDAELARIEEAEAAAQHQVNMGIMTNETLLGLQARFNAERLAAEQQFIDAKKLIELQDPDKNPAEMERLEAEKEEIRRRYAAQAADIQRQQALESQTTWQSLADSIAGLWDQGTQALMNGTLTWANAVKAIGATVLKWFLNDFIGAKVKAWITGEAAQTAATQTGTATRGAIESVASLKSIALWAKTAVKNIMTSAYEAMAAAWKAIVGIPYIGPVLAPVAAGAAFAGVAALANKVTSSAAGGYDIPGGVNPITQLHAREMVLPAKHADVIRSLADGDGSDTRPIEVHVHQNISAWDSVDARRALMDNQPALVEALKNAHRNGYK